MKRTAQLWCQVPHGETSSLGSLVLRKEGPWGFSLWVVVSLLVYTQIEIWSLCALLKRWLRKTLMCKGTEKLFLPLLICIVKTHHRKSIFLFLCDDFHIPVFLGTADAAGNACDCSGKNCIREGCLSLCYALFSTPPFWRANWRVTDWSVLLTLGTLSTLGIKMCPPSYVCFKSF